MNYKVSIGISIYNTEKYVEKALRSYFNQTMANEIQYVLVDDNSTDSSLEITKKVISDYIHLKDNITLIEHKKNTRVASCRNDELALFTGKYVVFCDSDDWAEPDHIEKLYKKAIEGDFDCVSCNYIEEYEGGKSYNIKILAPDNSMDFARLLLAHKINAFLWNRILKRELFVQNNIKSRKDIYPWDDFFVLMQFVQHAATFCNIPDFSYHYNRHNQNCISYTPYTYKKMKNIYHTVSETEKFYRKNKNYKYYQKSFFLEKVEIALYWFDYKTEFRLPFFFFNKTNRKLIKNNPSIFDEIDFNRIKFPYRSKKTYIYFARRKMFFLAEVVSILYYMLFFVFSSHSSKRK